MSWFEEFWIGILSSGITLLKVSQTDENQPTEETQKLISIPILDHRMSSLLLGLLYCCQQCQLVHSFILRILTT